MAKRIEKANLPTKICPVCNRPFAWRKKWARDWPAVIYCSRRCAAERSSDTKTASVMNVTDADNS